MEDSLRDTFEDIERNHQNEVKRLQQQINQMKGIEEEQMSENGLYGATQLKKNPLANGHYGPQQSHTPHTPTLTSTYSHNHNNQSKNNAKNLPPLSQQQSHSNGYSQQQSNGYPQQQRGSVAKYNAVPPPVAPQQQSHWKNKSAMPYQQQPRNGYNNAYHTKRLVFFFQINCEFAMRICE